jgi:hypothetical protein
MQIFIIITTIPYHNKLKYKHSLVSKVIAIVLEEHERKQPNINDRLEDLHGSRHSLHAQSISLQMLVLLLQQISSESINDYSRVVDDIRGEEGPVVKQPNVFWLQIRAEIDKVVVLEIKVVRHKVNERLVGFVHFTLQSHQSGM